MSMRDKARAALMELWSEYATPELAVDCLRIVVKEATDPYFEPGYYTHDHDTIHPCILCHIMFVKLDVNNDIYYNDHITNAYEDKIRGKY